MARLSVEGVGRFNIIDEDNADRYAVDEATRHFRGYTGRNYDENPYGSMPWGNFPLDVIPRSEWKDRIEEGHAKKTFAIYHHRRKKVPILDQKRTNYCWINAVVGAMMNMRACQNLPTIHLSSASAGAPGKNYANVGGWTGEAIRYIDEYKITPHDVWPNAAIDRSYFQKTREFAIHDVGNWWELRPRNFDQLMTCLLNGFCVAVGLNWWGHAVYYNAPVMPGRGSYGVIFPNSWGYNWEENGMSVLAESKANADEANCITQTNLVAAA